MALGIPANFKNDIQSNHTSIVPLIVIGNQDEQNKIHLSTNSGNILPRLNINFKPLLLNVPSLKESIDLETRKYKISSVTLDCSNVEYQGTRLSDEIDEKFGSLMNTEVRIFWSSPSTVDIYSFDVVPFDPNNSSQQDRTFQVYTGTVRRYTHTDEKVKIELEDRSQAYLHKDLPLPENYLGSGSDIPDKYKDKPIPMVYGHVDRSPCVLISPLTEGEDYYNEQNLTIQVDSIPVNLTDARLYVYDDYYYKLAKTQDYSIFGLENVYTSGELYTNNNTDNKIILKLSDATGITALANNNAHVKIEPKIQTLAVNADTTDAVIYDYLGHGFVEGAGLTSSITVSGTNDFINNNGALNILGKTFWIQSQNNYGQSILVSFTINPIPTNIVNTDIFRDFNLPIKPIYITIDPDGSIVATKYFGDVSGSDGHLFTTITTYANMGNGRNFDIDLRSSRIGLKGSYTFTNPNPAISGASDSETFSIINGFANNELIESISNIPNDFRIVFGVVDNPQIVDLDIILNKLSMTFEIMIQDVFKSKFYVNVGGRLSSEVNSPTAPSIIEHILENELGSTTDYISTIPTLYSDMQYSFTVSKKINSKKLIEGIASASPFIPHFNNQGSFKFDTIPSSNASSDHIIQESKIIDFSYKRTKIEDVKTKVELKYKIDYANDEFGKSVIKQENNADYFDYYGLEPDHSLSTLVVDDDRGKYIRDDLTADKFCQWLLDYHKNQHLIMTVKLPLSAGLPIEVGDIVEFDKLLGDVKPFGINYVYNYVEGVFEDNEKINGQVVFPNFIVTSTNKTLDMVTIECEQLHQLLFGYITADRHVTFYGDDVETNVWVKPNPNILASSDFAAVDVLAEFIKNEIPTIKEIRPDESFPSSDDVLDTPYIPDQVWGIRWDENGNVVTDLTAIGLPNLFEDMVYNIICFAGTEITTDLFIDKTDDMGNLI